MIIFNRIVLTTFLVLFLLNGQSQNSLKADLNCKVTIANVAAENIRVKAILRSSKIKAMSCGKRLRVVEMSVLLGLNGRVYQWSGHRGDRVPDEAIQLLRNVDFSKNNRLIIENVVATDKKGILHNLELRNYWLIE